MSSRIFQNVIIQMKDAVDRTIGVVDEQGFVVASSELAIIGSRLDDFHAYEFENADKVVCTGSRSYSALCAEGGKMDFAAFVEGTDQAARTICAVSAVAFNEARSNYEEKHNKAAFVKNIISDNILPGDVYVRAKELHFVTDEPRTVLLVRQTENSDVAAMEVIQRLFPDRQRDFVLNINETDVVVVKALSSPEAHEEVLKAARGIEVSQVFQLGTKYSEAMGATFMDVDGKERPFQMGCYGIGVSRTLQAVVEQHHDEHGIVWPVCVAPYEVEIVPLSVNDDTVWPMAEKVAAELCAAGLEVLVDDRKERAGVKFADADLMGFPYQVVLGKRGVLAGEAEVKVRGTVQEYNGRLQLRVEKWRLCTDDDPVDMNALVPCAPRKPEDMMKEIRDTVASFTSENLRRLTEGMLETAGGNLNWFPAAQRMHHAERSGLLHHTSDMLRLAKAMLEVYPWLNRDLLLAGVIIHDLGKIDELKSDQAGNVTDYTRDGQLLGHLVRGITNLNRVADRLGIHGESVVLLEHRLLSHHAAARRRRCSLRRKRCTGSI